MNQLACKEINWCSPVVLWSLTLLTPSHTAHASKLRHPWCCYLSPIRLLSIRMDSSEMCTLFTLTEKCSGRVKVEMISTHTHTPLFRCTLNKRSIETTPTRNHSFFRSLWLFIAYITNILIFFLSFSHVTDGNSETLKCIDKSTSSVLTARTPAASCTSSRSCKTGHYARTKCNYWRKYQPHTHTRTHNSFVPASQRHT